MPMQGDAMESGRNGGAPGATGPRNKRGFASIDYGKIPLRPTADERLSERV